MVSLWSSVPVNVQVPANKCLTSSPQTKLSQTQETQVVPRTMGSPVLNADLGDFNSWWRRGGTPKQGPKFYQMPPTTDTHVCVTRHIRETDGGGSFLQGKGEFPTSEREEIRLSKAPVGPAVTRPPVLRCPGLCCFRVEDSARLPVL